jgi:hypothetical protein
MRCETDILSPEAAVRTVALGCIENATFRSGKPASEGTLIGLDCLNWRQPELISRSLFRKHSRMKKQIALINPPVTNLI